jgi:hypothetical protein
MSFNLFWFCLFFMLLSVEPRALHMLGKGSPSPICSFLPDLFFLLRQGLPNTARLALNAQSFCLSLSAGIIGVSYPAGFCQTSDSLDYFVFYYHKHLIIILKVLH